MLTEQALMALHIHALFTHDAQARMLFVNEPDGGGPAPRLCMDEPVGMDFRRPPRHVSAHVRLLETHAPVQELGMGPAYRFPEYLAPSRPLLALTATHGELLRDGFETRIADLPAWQPFLGLVEEGRVVAICRSVRITPAAHEAGVETLPLFRGRGYAQDAVAGWASAVQATGALPLYSTAWENAASQAVASSPQEEMPYLRKAGTLERRHGDHRTGESQATEGFQAFPGAGQVHLIGE